MADNRFSGKGALLRRMQAIPLAARIAARDELRVQARKLVEAIKPNVPKDEGDLAASLESHDQASAATLGLGRITVVVTEGRNQEGDPTNRKARALEFGRPDMAAQPHFFPTFRARKRRIQNAVQRKARVAIRRAWGG